jgi:hypothetical protein
MMHCAPMEPVSSSGVGQVAGDRAIRRPFGAPFGAVAEPFVVAKCVTTGALKGRTLHLVGRADPRGTVEYNFVLGESRADSVSSYLEGLGVDSSRITSTSRGKLDATGTDEPTWQLDRRVDVDLAQ